MDRNRLLNLSFAACKILSVILFVIFGAYVFMFIHWHINPDFYEHVKIGNFLSNKSSIISMEEVSYVVQDEAPAKVKPDANKEFTLGNLNLFSFSCFLFRLLPILYLVF